LFQPKSQRALIEEAEHVDEELESSRIAKEKFGFQRIISNNACREHCGVTDSLFEFKTPDNKTVIVGSCGYGNIPFEWSLSYLISALLGFWGSGLFR
jgi:hypothetical protein